MSFHKSAKFKRLKAIWYRKLEDDGFTDIETHQGLVISDLSARVNFREGIAEVNYEYYSWARARLHGTRFPSKRARVIWTMHAEGKSSREIGKVVGLDQRRVSRLILQITEFLKKRN